MPKSTVAPLELQELAELRAAKAKHLGTGLDATQLNRWDFSFYSERVRKERYSIDQEALRKNFPTEASLKFTFQVVETLYGIKIKPAKAPTWHADVRYLEAFDAKTNAFIGGMYLDLFPREDKYNHAAAWPVRSAGARVGRKPFSVLVTNFNRDGLTHDELETLLHEFGHVLHGVLSTARYTGLAGTSVKQDFVEAPSQMFEEWARRPETLAAFKTVCKTCPQLSADDVARLDKARNFGRGVRYARQRLYAAYDIALNGPTKQDAMALWTQMEGEQPLGHVPGTMFPAGFGHLANHYGAGYFGYLWSEVLALDMLSAFKGQLMDPKVGRKYRNTILAQGGQRDPMELVTELLGRAPNRDAFLAEIQGKR
jgi:thimet oligopeptidase